MKEYRIIFHPKALDDFKDLDGRVRELVMKQIEKLKKYPQLGELLGYKDGYDLAGYRKLYTDNKRVRIIYSIIEDRILVTIVAIGQRDAFEVYKAADSRVDS